MHCIPTDPLECVKSLALRFRATLIARSRRRHRSSGQGVPWVPGLFGFNSTGSTVLRRSGADPIRSHVQEYSLTSIVDDSCINRGVDTKSSDIRKKLRFNHAPFIFYTKKKRKIWELIKKGALNCGQKLPIFVSTPRFIHESSTIDVSEPNSSMLNM